MSDPLLCRLRIHDYKSREYEKIEEYYYLIHYKCKRCGKETFEEIHTTPFIDSTKTKGEKDGI